MSTDSKSKLISGFKWATVKMLLTQSLSLVTIMILSRKLLPADFGLVALAYVAIRFIDSINGQVANFLIYDNSKKNQSKRQTGFWLNCLSSFIIVFLGFILAKNIDFIFDQPSLDLIILLLLIKIPFDSISKFLDSIILKELNFKAIEIRDFAISLASSVLSIFMALSGYGVWSLVIPQVILAPIKTLIMFRLTRWMPILIFKIEHAKEIISYSYNLILSKISYFIVTQTDNLFIGYFFNTTQLGFYNISWQASNLINRTLVKIVNKLTFPFYSANNVNENINKELIINSIYNISLFAFPVFIWMFFFAENFILTIFGSQWHDSIIPFQILLIYAIRYAVGSPIGPFFDSIGKPNINKNIGLTMVPFYIIGIYYGVNFGIIGVAISVTIIRTFFGLINFYILSKLINYKLTLIFTNLLKPLIVSLLSSSLTYMVLFVLEDLVQFNMLLKLVISFTLNLTLFMLFIKRIYKERFDNILELLNVTFPYLKK